MKEVIRAYYKKIDFQRIKRNGIFFLATFLFSLGILVIFRFISFWLSNIRDKEIRIDLGIAIVVAVTFLILFIAKIIWKYRIKIKNSKREDIIPPIVIGIMLLYFIERGKINEGVSLYISMLTSPKLFEMILIIIGLFLFLTINLKPRRKKEPQSLFLSDNPEDKIDYLGLKNDAEKFAEKIVNNWSSESIVFGIDAPWGGGKTTYLNFCLEYLKKKYKEKIIIFNFKPLRFENQESLFRNFIVGLATEINEKLYVPEISSNLIKYGRVIENIKIKTPFVETTFDTSSAAEKVYEKLKDELKKIDKKMIIAIDDLDRVQLNDLKLILNIVKISFDLPNLTFILCYDTENINTFELPFKKVFWEVESNIDKNYKNSNHLPSATFLNDLSDSMKAKASINSHEELDNQRISEYLEKIINVKKNLFIERNKLEKYFSDQMEILRKQVGEDKIDKASFDNFKNQLKDIFDPEKFGEYQPYIGDIRKIKRLINTIKLNDLFTSEEEFGQTDFVFKDLVNLLLIYINFPRIFRKIYATETDKASNFFSITKNYLSDGATYKNSDYYKAFLKDLSEKEKFLLEELFGEKWFDEKANKGLDLSLSAMHNDRYGDKPGNLERYLNYIAYGEKPEKLEQKNFHLLMIINLRKNNKIEDTFNRNEYKTDNGEYPRSLFFSILSANLNKRDNDNKYIINYSIGNSILEYLQNNITKYSLSDSPIYEGLRMNIPSYISDILNKKGWKDDNDDNINNLDNKYISEIARRIFGEDEYKNNGILEKLSAEERGILGIYDMLAFRLNCSRDRSGSYFNVYDSLAFHADEKASRSGKVSELVINQMREISQACFKIFKSRYIEKKINIFDECKKLKKKDVFGDFVSAVSASFEKSSASLEDEVNKIKNVITGFTLYQIGNSDINLGIGCGYYDPSGKKDNRVIQGELQKYLFDICLNIDEKNGGKLENGKYFIDFLLANLVRKRDLRNFGFFPSIDEFSKILGKDKLKNYWQKNGMKIKEYVKKLDQKTKIVTYNYIANYEGDTKPLFDELDKLISEGEK